ncbi:MAG: hypothetical protein WC953_11860 [Pseudomonas sp.]
MKPATTILRLAGAALLSAALAVLPATGYAQEDAPAEAPQQQRADAENDKKNEGQSGQARKDQGFRPSEEISEDLSVPFPVDI